MTTNTTNPKGQTMTYTVRDTETGETLATFDNSDEGHFVPVSFLSDGLGCTVSCELHCSDVCQCSCHVSKRADLMSKADALAAMAGCLDLKLVES